MLCGNSTQYCNNIQKPKPRFIICITILLQLIALQVIELSMYIYQTCVCVCVCTCAWNTYVQNCKTCVMFLAHQLGSKLENKSLDLWLVNSHGTILWLWKTCALTQVFYEVGWTEVAKLARKLSIRQHMKIEMGKFQLKMVNWFEVNRVAKWRFLQRLHLQSAR